MAELYEQLKPKSKYYDKKYFNSKDDYEKALETSNTVYVGNLSFYSTEDSLYELFSRCGSIADIKIGINDVGHPCGFCFVIFIDHESAAKAVEFISGTKLCDRIIRVDWDPGYKDGREKGRGSGGQQKRDDFRTQEDADRPIQKRENKFSHGSRYQRDDRSRGRYPPSRPRRSRDDEEGEDRR